MDVDSKGLILGYNCINTECDQFKSDKVVCIGYVHCELTRHCNMLKCDMCNSETEIIEIMIKNSKFQILGSLESAKEFDQVINKEACIWLKTKLDSIAYATINIEPYDKQSEIQTELEYLSLEEYDNEYDSYISPLNDNSQDQAEKFLFFNYLNIFKGIRVETTQETSLRKYSDKLESDFSVPFHYSKFYYKGKRIYNIDENIDTSQNCFIQLVRIEELNHLVIEIQINKDCKVNLYKIVLELPHSKTVYDALMELRHIYDLKDIFRGSFDLQGAGNQKISFNDRIRKEIHSKIFMTTFYPEITFNVSVCYNMAKTEIFSFTDGDQSSSIINQCSIFFGQDKRYLKFLFEDSNVIENVDFTFGQDYDNLIIFVEDAIHESEELPVGMSEEGESIYLSNC